MFQNFSSRSHKRERLDTGDYTDAEYEKWQTEMKLINRFLGDSRALKLALKADLRDVGDSKLSVLDVGAGCGELLKAASEMIGRRPAFMVGAELDHNAAKSIKARFVEFDVCAVRCDALQLPFADDSFDFVISSLFLHHLSDEQALILFSEMNRVARRKFIIIDLHRHAAAYHLYRIFGRMFLQRFTYEDGSLSILRAYRPTELEELAKSAGIANAQLERRFAFRLVLSGSKDD